MINGTIFFAAFFRHHAMGHHNFDTGDKIRDKISRHKNGTRIPGDSLPDIVKNLFITAEKTTVEMVSDRKPGRFVTAGPDGLLDRPQDAVAVVFLHVKQVTFQNACLPGPARKSAEKSVTTLQIDEVQ